MNVLTETCRQLAQSLAADPLLRLASAVATFDPYWNASDPEDQEEEPLKIALRVTRGAFPDVYAAAVERLRTGASPAELDRLICGEISAKGIPLDDLYAIAWGIPLPAFGADLTAPQFYQTHPDVLPVLALFGVRLPDDEYGVVEVPAGAYEIAGTLARGLHEQEDPALKQAGWLLGWLFSCTGNSLVNCTEEALSELEPLSWSADDVAFAVEMIAEAGGILADAMAGLTYLKSSPEFLVTLQRNIAQLFHTCTSGRPKESSHLRWFS